MSGEPDDPTTDIEALSPPAWALFAGTVVIFMLILVYLADQLFPENGIASINVVVGGALSFALATLYYYQTKIQNRQSQIMERQQRIMELPYIPRLLIQKVEFSDYNSEMGTHDDQIEMTLHNAGKGVATNISLRCDAGVFIDDEIVELEPDTTIQVNGEPFTFKPRLRGVMDPTSEILGKNIEPDKVVMEGETKRLHGYACYRKESLSPDNSTKRTVSFTELIETLAQSDADSISYQLTLLYRDMNENIYATKLYRGAARIQKGMTLAQSIEDDEETGGAGIPLSRIKREAADSLPKSDREL